MTTNPLLRLLAIMRFHYKWLFVGAVVSSFFAVIIGLMTPEVYRSQAVIQIDVGKRIVTPVLQMDVESDIALSHVMMLISSNTVLEKVAQEIIDENLDQDLAFPNRFKIADLGERFNFLMRRLNSNHSSQTARSNQSRDVQEVTARVGQQLSVGKDPTTRLIKIIYAAATPHLAQTICKMIVEHFMVVSLEEDRQELLRQEKYLTTSIKDQMVTIDTLETELRKIVGKNPEMASFREGQGISTIANNYLSRQGRLSDLEQDLKTNEHLLVKIKKSLKNEDLSSIYVEQEVKSKIFNELTELEFKKLEYTKVHQYPDSHPSVKAINDRIEVLKNLHAKMEVSSMEVSSQNKAPNIAGTTSPILASIESDLTSNAIDPHEVKDLLQKAPDLKMKTEQLRIERDLMYKELANHEGKVKKGLDIEFQINALKRELDTHISLMTDLRRLLEKIRVEIAGIVPSTSLASSPSFPVIPTTLSISRKALFSIFVGIVFVLSILFLIDLMNPKLLIFDDLKALNVGHFGMFKRNQKDAIVQFAAYMMSIKRKKEYSTTPMKLKDSQSSNFPKVKFDDAAERYINSFTARDEPTKGRGSVILLSSVSIQFNIKGWVYEVAKILRDTSETVGILIVDELPGESCRQKTIISNDIETTWLHPDEIAFSYDQIVKNMKQSFDWVFVIASKIYNTPGETFVIHSADHVLYLTKFGESELKVIQKTRALRNIINHPIEEHALVL